MASLNIQRTINDSPKILFLLSVVASIITGKMLSWLILGILMPHIGVLTGGANFNAAQLVLGTESINDFGEVVPAAILNIGNFMGLFVDSLLILLMWLLCMKLFQPVLKKNDCGNTINFGNTDKIEFPGSVAPFQQKYTAEKKYGFAEMN